MRRAVALVVAVAAIAGVALVVSAVGATPARAQDEAELLDFDTAYSVCRDRFLDGSIAAVWFASSLNALNEGQYRAQLDAGEITQDRYLELMRLSYQAEFNLYDFYRERVVPTGGAPDCQALVDLDQSPPADPTTPPVDTPDADSGAQDFVWDDPDMRAGFEICMQLVDYVANGEEGDRPIPFVDWDYGDDDVPAGVDRDLWNEASDSDYSLDVTEWGNGQEWFTFRPRCQLLLPADYTSRVATQYWTEAFSACLANVGTGNRTHERPLHVPAWYWEVAHAVGDCYLLLPLAAFGLGDGQPDQTWRSAEGDEPEVPAPSTNPGLNTEYQHCRDYIGWRMAGAATWPGLGDLYDDPPEGATPSRVWHEALDYYVDPGNPGSMSGRTIPADWKPNCGLILLYHPCERTDDALLPELCVGPHATANYDIGFSPYDDAGDDVVGSDGTPSVVRNLWGGLTGLSYQLGKHAVSIALWMVDWSLTFDISKYDVLALRIGDAYQDNLLGLPGFQLRELFWLVLVAWAGVAALRGRIGMAGAEIVLTVVLLLVVGVLMDHRDTYLTSTWRLMDDASSALLTAGTGSQAHEQPGTAVRLQLVEDTQRSLHEVFVEEPYDHLNWGRSLGDADDPDNPLRQCAAARYYILSMGPHGDDPWPRQQMTEQGGSGCQALVDYNRNPSGTRFVGAVLVLLSSVLVAVLLGLVGLTIVVAKFVALLLFAMVPFVSPFMILPGGGRRLGWSWVTTLMQVVTAIVAMSFLLSLLLITLKELNEMTGDVPVVERFLLMNLVVMVVFAARRSVLSGGQRFAAHMRAYLSATRGTGATWAGTAPASGNGLNLLGVDRGLGMAAGATTVAAWNRHVAMSRARYASRLGYKNLQAIAKWKRRTNLGNARWVDSQIAKQKLTQELDAPLRRQRLP
jgi:TrbL/VirB6 plasmid conjugal transfer protein